MTACLSELALDRLLLSREGAPEGQAAEHLGTCTTCQSRCEQRRQFEGEFEQTLAGPFWRAVVRAQGQRRRRRFLWMGLPPILAVAGALVFVVGRADVRPPKDDVLAKGPPSLEIHCRRDGRAFALTASDPVQAGDELRFVPRSLSGQARYVQVASIDGTGAYTPFYPAELEGRSSPLPLAGQPLAGSIRLDDAPGPERLFVVFSATPLPAVAVRTAARAHVADLSTTNSLDGVEVTTAWVVLDKTIPSSR
jgi:hypothetical protein